MSADNKLKFAPMVAAVAATTSAVLPVFLTGPLFVQMGHSFVFTSTELGEAIAGFFISAAVCSILFARFVEKIGPIKIMRIGISISALTMLLISFWAKSWPELALCLMLGGTANGIVQPSANSFLSKSVRPSRQGLAFGIKQSAIPTATLLAGLAVPLVALTIGWRWVYFLGVFISLISLLLMPKHSFTPTKSPSAPKATIHLRPLLILTIAMTLGSSAANALGTFAVPYGVFEHFTPGQAGLIAALGSVGALFSRLFVGNLADKLKRGHLNLVMLMLGVGAMAFATLSFGMSSSFIPAIVIGFMFGWGWTGLFNFVIATTHPQAAGHATGITQSGAFLGAIIGPVVFGLLIEHGSYQWAWIFCLLAAAGGSIFMLIGKIQLLKFLEEEQNQLKPIELGNCL